MSLSVLYKLIVTHLRSSRYFHSFIDLCMQRNMHRTIDTPEIEYVRLRLKYFQAFPRDGSTNVKNLVDRLGICDTVGRIARISFDTKIQCTYLRK